MLSKWWWRFKTDKDALWRRVIWAVHHNNRSWTPIPAKVSLAGPWKQIVGIREHLNQVGINLPDSIWCLVGIGSKVGVVSWRAIPERLPTRAALAARNIDNGDTRCPLCGEYEDTSDHLFVSCHFTQSIWLVIAQWCRIPPMVAFSLKDVLDTHVTVYGSKKKKKVISAIIQVVIWSVWRMRNKLLAS
ncbi:uncharacterized protein LOC118490545 [Helianthus annuus]|uniref:uncharacterized protein LOC118490545 n=1 Tax=Helianthus annuus TaxID=4232 RepID=UPI0016532DD1|nr:uncharacterized protein LOC118490545 [Helianthus annuus]